MKDAKELRIGNLVTGGSRGKVTAVTAEIIKGISDGVCVYNAIPLTEEWVIKFDFTKFGVNWRLGSFEYCAPSNQFVIHGRGGYYVGILLELMYVHQLQNLYFALTGEELKLN